MIVTGHLGLPPDFQKYFNSFSIWGSFDGKHGLLLPYTTVTGSVQSRKSIWSVWKQGGEPWGHLVEMPCWQMWETRLQKLKTHAGVNAIPSRRSRPSDSGLRSSLSVMITGVPGSWDTLWSCVWLRLCQENQRGLEVLVSLRPPGIQDPWRYPALTLLLLERRM